jgi:hypothetical protein
VLTACGSAGGSSNSVTKTTVPVSRKIVLTSIMTTAAAKTARIEMEEKATGAGAGFTMTGEGVVDFGSGDSQLSMSIDGAIGNLVQNGFEERTVDGVLYARVPSLSRGLPGGKPWIAVEVPGGANNGVSTSPLGLMGPTDPSQAIAYLEKVSNDVRLVGHDQIHGVDTTHYSATLDLAKAIDGDANVPPGLRDSMKELAGLFGHLPADVWIDADGRLRQERIQLDLDEMFGGIAPSSTEPSEHTVITATLSLYDFGTPVNVEAPPADQVTQFPNAGDVPSLKIDANA